MSDEFALLFVRVARLLLSCYFARGCTEKWFCRFLPLLAVPAQSSIPINFTGTLFFIWGIILCLALTVRSFTINLSLAIS